MHVEARTPAVRFRRRKARSTQLLWRWALAATVVLVLAGLGIGIAFSGSEATLPTGVTIAGVDVGGLTAAEAQRVLERRFSQLRTKPVVFTSGAHRWNVTPVRLGVTVDWAGAVRGARELGDGVGPLRGFRRLRLRVFGSDLAPPAHVWEPALDHQLRVFARALDRPHRDASLRLRGLGVAVVPGQDGLRLDRKAAASVVARALSSLSRAPVGLPVRLDPQTVTARDLRDAARKARVALSAPVRLALGPTRWRLARWSVAKLLHLPSNGSREVTIGGPGAARYFAKLRKRIDRAPTDADFAITSTAVRVVPDREGLAVDVEATRKALVAAALSPTDRLARVTVVRRPARRTTAEARAMGIRGLVGGYETIYGGEPNRIHNVQLVSQLIDRTLIPPGATFSFNETTGERTSEKGFREAPVIINGELQTGLGGGVCQVSTTVFNAAYEAGLKITERTNHALYIDHYPLARDATVNYPDIDLRFVNDTPKWLLLRTFVGPSSLTVNLYGTPVHRRVESQTSPLTVTGATPVKRVSDPNLYVGASLTEDVGSPPRSTSVRRLVYSATGKVLHDDRWSSYYRGEPTVIRVGTKPKPRPKPEPKPKSKPEEETQPKPEATTPPQKTPATPPPPSPPPVPPG